MIGTRDLDHRYITHVSTAYNRIAKVIESATFIASTAVGNTWKAIEILTMSFYC